MADLLHLQNIILEMVAKGDPLSMTTDRLCREVEHRIPDVICSVLVVDENGTLRPLSAPSLPDHYSARLNGLAIGPLVGSCGAAAYLGEPVSVTNIGTDPRWAEFKRFALPLGLMACWSSPIFDSTGRVVGTFAFYYRENRHPGQLERAIVHTCVHLCAIAIERDQRVVERERKATTDDLTKLQNRAAFDSALAQLSCEDAGAWALLVADMDNLKIVNDTFGHQAGDRMLQTVAARMAAALPTDQIYRLGGDEFAVLLRHPDAVQNLERAAGRILAALRSEVDVGGHLITPRVTIGGATLTGAENNADAVRQNADFALYHGKETDRGSFVRYSPEIGTTMARRLVSIRNVDEALREDRMEVHYQPVVNLDTREIIGMEALCRLRSGDRVLAAGEFFDALSDARIASEITTRMLGQVAADVRYWLDRGIPFQHVGINVSSADFYGGKLDRQVSAAFARHGVPLTHVILEVTESVYMGERESDVRLALAALRAAGLRIALDDFGTGYASLTHLLTVPVDVLKIDKSFIAQLSRGAPSEAIVEAILTISRKLGMRVVAEGIEREDQVEQLRSYGCTLGQGFLFSEAVDLQVATRLLEQLGQARPAGGGTA
ncbi:diguanylate cyclase [Croceibacterium mercuriale]|uniref:Diguanylate cyclase n=1 Tax=Croceibacterium mercuriale TaxID=1572751 RepID=A0A0B2BW86_9SPHN|nr:sensor domain-containing phosphodiesterase [Croceibacterium mercuriale]KHL25883.1 diguanylate cyclase [Croceibacterium mercuriale]